MPVAQSSRSAKARPSARDEPERRGLKRQDVCGVVATLDTRQPQEAVNQQRAADEQHHGHRDLGHDEGPANPMTHLLLAEQIRVALARLLDGGNKPEQQTRPASATAHW